MKARRVKCVTVSLQSDSPAVFLDLQVLFVLLCSLTKYLTLTYHFYTQLLTLDFMEGHQFAHCFRYSSDIPCSVAKPAMKNKFLQCTVRGQKQKSNHTLHACKTRINTLVNEGSSGFLRLRTHHHISGSCQLELPSYTP